MSFAPDTETFAKPETLFRVPVGLASPLWGLFAGAAMTGATWWWMTRWTQVQNLEAMFGAAGKAQAVVEPEMAAPVAEAVEAVVEAMLTPGLEAVAESTDEPILEALIAAPAVSEPVGGEAAPVSPVLAVVTPEIAEPRAVETPANIAFEAAPAPRPRKKPPESQPADTSV
jgi:hypothetical protein